jgi:hypothetical protein
MTYDELKKAYELSLEKCSELERKIENKGIRQPIPQYPKKPAAKNHGGFNLSKQLQITPTQSISE